MVIAQLESSLHKPFHVHRLVNHLARGRRFAFLYEVAQTKLFRTQAHRFSHLIQMSLKRKDALRRAEAAKSSVRRNIRGNRLASYANVRAIVWPGGVNRAARENDRRKSSVSSAVHYEI